MDARDLDMLGMNLAEVGTDCISRQAVMDVLFSEPLFETGLKKRGADVVVPVIYEKIKSLPSAKPEQTDCEFCHQDFDGYVRPIEKNSHAWLVRRGRTIKLRVCFKGGNSECDIFFCPMCGRRLIDE